MFSKITYRNVERFATKILNETLKRELTTTIILGKLPTICAVM